MISVVPERASSLAPSVDARLRSTIQVSCAVKVPIEGGARRKLLLSLLLLLLLLLGLEGRGAGGRLSPGGRGGEGAGVPPASLAGRGGVAVDALPAEVQHELRGLQVVHG